MLKELVSYLFEQNASAVSRKRTGERIALPGPDHVQHFIDRDGVIHTHIAQPDDVEYVIKDVEGLCDYLVAIQKANEFGESDERFHLENCDVFVSKSSDIEVYFDRDTRRDGMAVKIRTTIAWRRLWEVCGADSADGVVGTVLRQDALLRFLTYDLAGHVSAESIRRFENIRWHSTDAETTQVLRDKTSLGREIESRAASMSSGTDPGELPDSITVTLPVCDDPIFENRERWETIQMFVIPDTQGRAIELAVHPDHARRAVASSTASICEFIRTNLTARIGDTGIRIIKA